MSQTINVTAFAGVPCYGKLFADGSDVQIGTDIDGVEGRPASFAFAVDGSLTGLHNLDVYRTSSNAFLGRLWARLQGDGSSVDGEESAALAMQLVSDDLTPTIVRPIFGVVEDDDQGTTIRARTGEFGVPISVPAVDANGATVPLSGYSDLRIIIETLKPRKEDVQVIEHAAITISGTGNNVFSFQPSADVLAKEAQFDWSLRTTGTGEVIMDGTLIVKYSPDVDS